MEAGPYHQIKSRTPEERRQLRDARDAARRQANQKGADGILVTRGGTIQAGPELTDPSPFGANSGAGGNLVPVVVSGCLNGAFAVGIGAYYTVPS